MIQSVSGGSDGKASAHNVGDQGSIPRLGRSPGEGNGNPLPACGFPGGLDGKEPACNAGDQGSIPRLGRSPGEGNGFTLLFHFHQESL